METQSRDPGYFKTATQGPEQLPSSPRPSVPRIKTEFTLPHLRDVIPEFHTHAPSGRPIITPRSRRATNQFSPSTTAPLLPPPITQSSGPSSAASEVSASMPCYPSPKRRRLSYHPTTSASVPATPRASVNASLEPDYHYQESAAATLKANQYTSVERRSSAVSVSSSGPSDGYPSAYATSRPAMPPPPPNTYDSEAGDRRYLPGLLGQPHQPMFPTPFDHERRPNTMPSINRDDDRRVYMPPSPRDKAQSLYPNHYISGRPDQLTRPPLGVNDRTAFSGAGSLHPHQMESGEQYDQNRLGKRRRGNLPKHVTDLLRSWLHAHIGHPYPTEDQKHELVAQTGLTMNQISNWFINARRRRLPALASTNNRLERDSKPSHPSHMSPPHSSHQL